MPPKVTIGLPVYNGEPFLEEALDAIVHQSFHDFELIISDNASTDNTEEICRRYAEQHPNIRYIRQPKNQGAAQNYNIVFEAATGEYFRWAAADDLIAPTYLETCAAILDQQPEVVVCYPRSMLIDEEGHELRQVDDRMSRPEAQPAARIQKFRWGACHPVFGLIRTEALRQTDVIGAYPSSDVVLLFQLLLLGQFHEVPEVLFYRRTHPASSVRANPDMKSRMRWFAPGQSGTLYLPNWHRVYKFIQAVNRTPMSNRERAKCYRALTQRYLFHPKWMVKDIALAAQEFVGASPLEKRTDLV